MTIKREVNPIAGAGISIGVADNTATGQADTTIAATGAVLPDPVTVPHGGTGDVTLTAHGVLIGNGTSAVNVTSAGSAQQSLTSSGAGADPIWSLVSLTGGVSGNLPAGNGGTGLATLTAHAVVLGEGTSAVGFAGPGAVGTVLTGQGASADPTFAAPAPASGAVAAHGFVSALGTAIPALPGAPVTIATVTVTTTQANQRVQILVTGAWNDGTLAGLNNNAANIVVDGAATAATRAMFSTAAGESAPFAVNWEMVIATAAAHTFAVTLNRSAVVACQGDADITVNAYVT